jgi:enoyl-[acyl-carrier protein] reductase II
MFQNNRIRKLLKIEYPIIQGAMAWISDAKLAAAVSNGGGLGIIAASSAPVEMVEKELVKIRTLTDKPFGLNIMLMSPTASDIIELAKKYKVPIVTCGAGRPERVTTALKDTGTVVIPVVNSIKHAMAAYNAGADAVIAEGCESGGHVGHTSTMPLIPEIVDSVDIPVIAAGGIFDGRGMCAAFALGAEGIQMGTIFICAEETNVHAYYKQLIIQAKDDPTAVTGASIGHPVRAIKNKLIDTFIELEERKAPIEEIQKLGTGKLRLAVETGDQDMGSFQCGEVCGLVNYIAPAKIIIQDVVTGFEGTRRKLANLEND